jgi:hypothetical protein
MRQLLLLPCLFISQSLLANNLIWTDITQSQQFRSIGTTDPSNTKDQRLLKLDLEQLQQRLSPTSASSSQVKYLDLPLPNGQQMQFKLEPTSVMAAALSERYPEIRTWKISNPQNSAISGRIDLTPNGFHGLINTPDGNRVFIDPEGEEGLNRYVSRNFHNHETDHGFTCQIHGKSSPLTPKHSPLKTANRLLSRPADSLRTYRIAIATTGEYTQLFGGTKSRSLASVVTTLNRLNQVFERDLSLHFELVANNDNLLYTSPSSDPYSNEDAAAMVEENIVNIDAVIGHSNYDIGHVFGTGNTGGLAFINSTCGTYKAGGVRGSNSPTGESFNIDYVAHEIGHQLGASHTFNGTQLNCSAGNRTGETAVEPGSGSSIMGYAGICASDNLQNNSDAFFHSTSINQIKTFTQNASGSSCGILTLQNNNDPTVSGGADYTIPAETPFKLTGTTSDADADAMVHSWEQIDTGSAGGLYTDLGDNPLFRTWPPVTSTSRFFPNLSDLLNGTNTVGELLPTTDRQMNFTLLTRDNNGGIAQDSMEINVVNTGNAFAVLSQSSATTLSASQSIAVQWDIAGTTQPPISCSNVNIGLIDSNGVSTSLITNTPNDGSESLVIPANIVSMSNAHIQVSCTGNIFFAVSQGKINVLGGYPVLSANSPSITEEDSGIQYLTFMLSLSATASENIAISYTVTDSITSATVQQGTVVINQGSNSINIQVPVAGDTLDENNQVLNLSVLKPLNAQFADEGNILTTSGTIIDDDTTSDAVAANPETPSNTNSSNSSSGGGSFSLLSIFGLLLLFARRKIILRIK